MALHFFDAGGGRDGESLEVVLTSFDVSPIAVEAATRKRLVVDDTVNLVDDGGAGTLEDDVVHLQLAGRCGLLTGHCTVLIVDTGHVTGHDVAQVTRGGVRAT